MANPEHLAILKQGVEAWNKWRKENPEVKPDLGRADISGEKLNGVNLSGANLSWANLCGANLQWANLSASSLIEADLSGTDLSGACLDDANLSGWIIKDVICTHIIQRGQRIDFAPGEFEKKYTWLESVAEVMLRLPLSDLTLYAGPLMAQAVNQAHGEAVAQFKGVEALSDDTTSLEFVLFGEAQEEIKASLQRIEEAVNRQAPALAAPAPDESGDIIKWRNSWGPSWSPVVVDLQAAEAALVRRFSKLPPSLQTLWQLMQSALKP